MTLCYNICNPTGVLMMTENQTKTQRRAGYNIQLDPIDWSQLQLHAKLTPGQRMLAMARVSAFNRSILRGAFQRRFPNQPLSKINMLMLDYLNNISEYRDG
jgi:hypothetical protein